MASEIPIWLALKIDPSRSDFLEGLETWLRLGLISDAQVRQLCRSQLVCVLPASPASAQIYPPTASSISSEQPTISGQVETLPEPQTSAQQPLKIKTPAQDPLVRLLQSLMAELSVRWLLFLGVFMVVVSSGVLAATQWQNFTLEGQYSILFVYTLAFWGASAWTSRKMNLRLTAQMLQLTTLLIIPVNFWMMDGLNLFRSEVGWIVAAIAALTLTGLWVLLQRSHLSTDSRPILLNSIGLSWLQWGWGWPGIPLIAVYVGAIATAITLYYQDCWNRHQADERLATERVPLERLRDFFTPGIIAVLGGAVLLVFRATIIRGIPLQSMGLAFGICGWLICWLVRRESTREIWTLIGVGILIGGRLVSLNATTPWQAIALSGLVLWLLVDQLQRRWQPIDLIGLFWVGLQTLWPLRRLLSETTRQQIVEGCIQIAGFAGMPTALWGVTLFPYIVLWIVLAIRLRQWQKADLAKQAEWMTLILGACLAWVSWSNLLLRSLNLTLSATALISVALKRQDLGQFLVYVTHVTGLAAIAAWIHYGFPTLSLEHWADLLLIGMAAEWMVCILNWEPRIWRVSAWYLGLVLAATSYTLLVWGRLTDSASSIWGVLAIPLMLTVLATRPCFWQPRLAAKLSTLALIAIQPITFSQVAPRFVGLGWATGLMAINTRQLQHTVSAAINIGFGLTFVLAAIWQVWGSTAFGDWFLVLVAIAAFVLWGVRDWLRRQTSSWTSLYKSAADGWAIAILVLSLLTLTLLTILEYWPKGGVVNRYDLQALAEIEFDYRTRLFGSALLFTLATSYRTWQQSSELGFYGIAWSLELTLARVFLLVLPVEQLRLLDALAIANLALSLITQLAGDGWVKQSGQMYRTSWHVIPLIYVGLGGLLHHRDFTSSTGLYTLAAALVGIGVGRRLPALKLLTYLSIVGVTWATYELLIYQLLQAKGGQPGDGLVLLAALGTVLAVGYRLCDRWLLPYLRLSVQELRTIAHLHWAGSSVLLLIALGNEMSRTGSWQWTGVAAVLTGYALVQGRAYELWTYFGLFEAGTTLGYMLHRSLPDSVLLPWAGAIAAIVSFGLYVLPWSTWGWTIKPWRQAALILPGIIVLLTADNVAITSLLIVAAFYAWQAQVRQQIRISYGSILLADWGIWRLLEHYQLTGTMVFAALMGSSLLYVAQVDPTLRSPDDREKRHLLRVLASSLICLTALHESDGKFVWGFLAAGFSLLLVFAGLLLRTRAFLYVGTAAFVLKVLRQFWLFIADYSLLLWAIGIVLGLIFIWIAATFEARRHQMLALLQYWIDELREWY
jgi:hypothetical protein